MTVINESIMKTDRLGRLRYSPEQKKTMVDAYLASGLSAPRFAALHGVNYQTLVYWIKKTKTSGPADLPQSLHRVLSSLIPAEIAPLHLSRPDDAIEVLLPGGTRFLISSPGQLDLAVVLIRELQNSRPC